MEWRAASLAGELGGRRGDGVTWPGSPLAQGSWGSSSTTRALPAGIGLQRRSRVLLSRQYERDDSLIIHGHGRRDERELPGRPKPA